MTQTQVTKSPTILPSIIYDLIIILGYNQLCAEQTVSLQSSSLQCCLVHHIPSNCIMAVVSNISSVAVAALPPTHDNMQQYHLLNYTHRPQLKKKLQHGNQQSHPSPIASLTSGNSQSTIPKRWAHLGFIMLNFTRVTH